MVFDKYRSENMTAQEKIKAIERVLLYEDRITDVARDYRISRESLYNWINIYKKASNRNRSTLLTNSYVYGDNHPRAKRYKALKTVRRIVYEHPDWGCRKISDSLKKYGISLGYYGVYSILKDLKAETPDRRENLKRNYAGPGRLAADIRKEIVEKYIRDNESISDLSDQYDISRQTIYNWIENYKKNPSNEAFQDKYVKGEDHPHALYPKLEDRVLEYVSKNPLLSINQIAESLTISSWTVWTILNRNNLNTFSQRKAYAESLTPTGIIQTPYVDDRVRSVWDQFVPNVAPAPPPSVPSASKSSTGTFLKYFIASIALSTLFILGGSYWIKIFQNAGNTSQLLGFVFATIALLTGSFFFLYSLKYYITTAIVLSFSQDERKKDRFSKGKLGLIAWLLGVSIEGEDGKKAIKSVGLEPNLDHIGISKYPFVSVHIPFYNEKKVVERSINAAVNLDYPEYEVIFCDDSTDTTPEIIQNIFKEYGNLRKVEGDGWSLTIVEARPGVTLKHLHRTSRSGFKGAALKLALTLVDPRTEFVSVFDADFVPYPDSLILFLKYFKLQNQMSEDYKRTNVAAVQGYQWHTLNKSENWITRGVRSEYAGSYIIERSGIEIYGGLKQISGSVYMIRKDVLDEVGWGTSITEDFELTLRLYDAGYKVVYTPYIQAPAECVSTLKRLIRQRMRWAEGHSHNVKLMWFKLLRSEKVTFTEKLEFTYLMPYYLQAFFFIVGTVSWLAAEVLFPAKLPFWTSLWGWSLVLTNILALPLMNAVGLFLEESEERDYAGLLSFIALSYIVVPFQAYAAVKGFIEKEEGPWFRTPKTGRVTDIVARGRFMRLIAGVFHGFGGQETHADIDSKYLALETGNNTFNSFKVKPGKKLFGKMMISIVLIVTLLIHSAANNAVTIKASGAKGSGMVVYADSATTDVMNYRIMNTSGSWIGAASAVADVDGTNTMIPKLLELYSSSTRDEEILLSTNSDGTNIQITGQVYNGTTQTWGNVQQIESYALAGAPASLRRISGGYLNNGNFMAFTADGTAIVQFSIWNGSSWSTVSSPTVTIADTSEIVSHIKAAVRPGTNEVMIAIFDSLRDTNTIYYDGAGTATTDFTRHSQHAATSPAVNDFATDFVWSTNNPLRGELLFQDSTTDNTPNVNVFTADGSGGGSWGTANQTANVGGVTETGQITERPGTNEFLMCVKDTVDDVNCIKEADNDTTPTTATTTQMELTATSDTDNRSQNVDLGYEQSTGGTAIAVYALNTGVPQLKKYTASTSTWDASATTLADQTEAIRVVEVYPKPNSDDMAIITRDTSFDAHLVFWDGANDALYSSGDRATQQLSANNGSNTQDKPFSFAWDQSDQIPELVIVFVPVILIAVYIMNKRRKETGGNNRPIR